MRFLLSAMLAPLSPSLITMVRDCTFCFVMSGEEGRVVGREFARDADADAEEDCSPLATPELPPASILPVLFWFAAEPSCWSSSTRSGKVAVNCRPSHDSSISAKCGTDRGKVWKWRWSVRALMMLLGYIGAAAPSVQFQGQLEC